MVLHLLQYNNYYNRHAKKEATLAGYQSKGTTLATFPNIDFNPSDGINANQIVNFVPAAAEPDYLLVCDDSGNIDSRWFIVESTRTRGGQYNLGLRRDVIADCYDYVLSAPAFIEKATLPNDGSDPFIHNPEQMTFNQILKSRTPLYDKTGVPWMVIYSAKGTQIDVEFSDKGVSPETFKVFNTEAGMRDFYSKWSNYQSVKDNSNVYLNYYFNVQESGGGPVSYGKFVAKRNTDGTYSSTDVANGGWSGWTQISSGVAFHSASNPNPPADADWDSYLVYNYDMYNLPTYSEFGRALNNMKYSINKEITDRLAGKSATGLSYGQMIEDSKDNGKDGLCPAQCFVKETGKIYRVNVTPIDNSGLDTVEFYNGKLNDITSLSYPIIDSLTNQTYQNYEVAGAEVQPFTYYNKATKAGQATSLRAVVETSGFSVTYTDITSQYNLLDKIVYSQGESKLSVTEDEPYNVMCLPFGSLNIRVNIPNGSQYTYTSSKEVARLFASAVAQKYSGNGVYDIQIVPYCPLDLDEFYVGDQFTVNNLNINQTDDMEVTVNGAKSYQQVFISNKASRERNLSYSFPITNYKVQSLTEFHRLVSPNGAGIFEFNAAMNHGINGFKALWTLKPGLPFIQIKPNFGGMYGASYAGDTRGLICGGDFSIAQTSDIWQQYVVNNKNYQNSFNRNIENLETMRSIDRINLQAQLIAGTLSGAASGATTGMLASGGGGAMAGGVVGGIASAIGGYQDYKLSEQKYEETIDYTKDQFAMSMENIKARPDSLFHTSGINIMSSLVPVLEFYQATDKEIEALQNKIKWNGMTVGRIGKFSDYLNNSEWRYIKGKVIQLSDGDASFPNDFHLVNELSNEMFKGLFMTLRGDL